MKSKYLLDEWKQTRFHYERLHIIQLYTKYLPVLQQINANQNIIKTIPTVLKVCDSKEHPFV